MLECLMERDGNYIRIKSISNSLVEKGILKHAVEQEIMKYDARREQILPLVRFFLLYIICILLTYPNLRPFSQLMGLDD